MSRPEAIVGRQDGRCDLLLAAAALIRLAADGGRDANSIVASSALTERALRMLMAAQGGALLELTNAFAGEDDPRAHQGSGEASLVEQRPDDIARVRRHRRILRAMSRKDGEASADAEVIELARGAAVAELALAWSTTSASVRRRLRVAEALSTPGRLPPASAPVRTGCLDWSKAEVTHRATADLSDDKAGQVDALVIPWAMQDDVTGPGGLVDVRLRTVPLLREALAAAVHSVDPEGAAERASRARRGRYVRCYPLDDADGQGRGGAARRGRRTARQRPGGGCRGGQISRGPTLC